MYRGELFNSISHLVGSVFAIIGTSVLMTTAVLSGPGGARRMTALAVYGGMLVVLYLSSTLYHSLRGPAKKVFHVFDHCAIYLLIAGTYTPFALITLTGAWRWSIFFTIWGLAIAGVAKDVFFHNRYRGISVALYVLMGWIVVVAFAPLQRAIHPDGIRWLIAGGLVYTGGLLFYALSSRVLHAHGVWHLCVLVGSVCHYIAIFRYVAIV